MRPVLALLAIPWGASVCSSFSFDVSIAPRRQGHSSGIRLPPGRRSQWNTPRITQMLERGDSTRTAQDLHATTIRAISRALLLRAQNAPGMRLRFVDDGSMEAWEVTLAAGKIAQRAVEEWRGRTRSNIVEDEEAMQVVAGRVVAVLTRFEELEAELLGRCCRHGTPRSDGFFSLGVPEEEMKAWRSNSQGDDSAEITIKEAAAIDAACLFDESLRHNRARSLLAMFLHEIEGPGLRRNNVIIPCMDVDFLSDEEWGVLFGSQNNIEEMNDPKSSGAAVASKKETSSEIADENLARPSLHPITIDAIEEAFRLRSQNMSTSPLRLIDAQTEWCDVHYSIIKFADRFLEKYTNQGSKGKTSYEFQWTEEELQTIGGRIVGVLMRLDDLEWEWNNRVCTSSLAGPDSLIPHHLWKSTLGLHPGNIEQNCTLTLDTALSTEKDFARARAERMLALFLTNIEAPGLEASGQEVTGGSHPNFIEDPIQLELMIPRPKK
jgi:hypothetical protein